MEKRKPPLILVIPGLVAIIGIPLIFFVFGWHAVDIACEREEQNINCQIEESFAAGLHVRKALAAGVNDIAYETHRNRSTTSTGSHAILTSNMVFETTGGTVDITSISSNTADEAKRQLIMAFRAWRDAGASQRFKRHAGMVDIFGWLGALGMAFWAWILISWPYYYFKQRKTRS